MTTRGILWFVMVAYGSIHACFLVTLYWYHVCMTLGWINIYIFLWYLMVIGSLCVSMFVFGSEFMRLVVWISLFFCSDLPPPGFNLSMKIVCLWMCCFQYSWGLWFELACVFCSDLPPSQAFKLIMKTYLMMKTKKEPFWKKNNPQIGKTQEDHYMFAATCWKQTSQN